MEKYNAMDTSQNAGGGEYPNQDGFGWTNGVYLKLKNLKLLFAPFLLKILLLRMRMMK
jgi:neutral trehalase